MSEKIEERSEDATPRFVARLLEQRNGVFLVWVRGKRIVRIAPCRVPFLPPTTEVHVNHTEHYLRQMLEARARVFVAHLASGAIVGLGTVEPPLDVGST